MNSGIVEATALLGAQQARISHFPVYASSSGDEAIALARLAGIEPDPWQQTELRPAMGESPDWKCPKCTHRSADPIPCPAHPHERLIHPWAAFEVVDVDPRQNGKSEKFIIRQLAGLYVLEEQLQIYSAHLFDTAMEIFRRLVYVVENCDDLRREVKHRGSKMVGIKYSHGEEGIELRDGRRIRFKARTAGGGRGFSCDCLYLDEAMILPERFLGATVPTLSARPNPQIWFAGSAPDEEDPSHEGVVLAKRRARALTGEDRSLAYFEHSAEGGDDPGRVPKAVLDDPEQWALANPGLGIRITPEYVSQERAAMGARQFAVERLGIGAWPDISEDAGRKIPVERWAAALDRYSKRGASMCFAFDISPDRSTAAISVGSLRPDGHLHGEVIEHGPGTEWIIPRLLELKAWRPAAILWDSLSQANSLKDEIAKSKLRKAEAIATSEAVQACGVLFDALTQSRFHHIGQPELDAAVDGAGERLINDGSAWLWSRRISNADITPLVSLTLAVWAASSRRGRSSGVVSLADALAAAEQS